VQPFTQIGKPYELKLEQSKTEQKLGILRKWLIKHGFAKAPKPKAESTEQNTEPQPEPSEDEDTREEQDRIEYPEEPDYPDSTDSDLIEFDLDEEE